MANGNIDSLTTNASRRPEELERMKARTRRLANAAPHPVTLGKVANAVPGDLNGHHKVLLALIGTRLRDPSPIGEVSAIF